MKEEHFRKNGPKCFSLLRKEKNLVFEVQNATSNQEDRKFKRHYETHHPELKNLDRELRKMKIEDHMKDLHAQQSIITSFCRKMMMCSL